MTIRIIILLILIIINAFFAASEIALISLNDNKIKKMSDEGDKKAKQLVKLLSEPSRFLATIQVGITLAGFLASAFAAESFVGPMILIKNKYSVPISDEIFKIIAVIIITIILSYFSLVFGELVPKRIAMNKSYKISFSVVKPLTILSKVASPFVSLLTKSTNSIVRLFGINPVHSQEGVTEEEIRLMLDIGEEKGTIEEHERKMINNIFEFNNKKVEDVMTHRTEILAIDKEITLNDLVEIVNKKKFTRMPVYEDSIDNIIGILSIKDLIRLINEDVQDIDIEKFIRKPLFVLTYERLDELLFELQEAKAHMAIVIDEYGGTAGIVTMEDLVEEIVGEIFDEYDTEEDFEVKYIGKNTYEVDAIISLFDLSEYLEIKMPVEEFDTLNGFLISLIGKIPLKEEVEDMDEIDYENIKIKILEVTEKRIEKVLISINI